LTVHGARGEQLGENYKSLFQHGRQEALTCCPCCCAIISLSCCIILASSSSASARGSATSKPVVANTHAIFPNTFDPRVKYDVVVRILVEIECRVEGGTISTRAESLSKMDSEERSSFVSTEETDASESEEPVWDEAEDA
jgi:hypothetical protein